MLGTERNQFGSFLLEKLRVDFSGDIFVAIHFFAVGEDVIVSHSPGKHFAVLIHGVTEA